MPVGNVPIRVICIVAVLLKTIQIWFSKRIKFRNREKKTNVRILMSCVNVRSVATLKTTQISFGYYWRDKIRLEY